MCACPADTLCVLIKKTGRMLALGCVLLCITGLLLPVLAQSNAIPRNEASNVPAVWLAQAGVPAEKASIALAASNRINGVGRPTIYLDCQRCDYNHIRSEITFVDYLRDPEQADIHLFITAQTTGDGGLEYHLSFMGRGGFSEINYSFYHLTTRSMTVDQRRNSLNEAIRNGLTPFLLKTHMASHVSVRYQPPAGNALVDIEPYDPWNNWVFQIYAGSLQLQLESNRRSFDSRWGMVADRVTEDWKIRIQPYFIYNFREIDQSDGRVFSSHNIRHGLTTYVIKSLSDHWSAGLFGTYVTREDINLRHRFQVQPGLEYSLYPYQQATRRAVTLTWRIGYTYSDYHDTTIFNKDSEMLLNQRLEARAVLQQPWGSVNAGIIGSHYFHDTDLRRLQTFTRFSVRVTEGLSLSLQTDFNIIQDQITLRARSLDLEDILLAQREMATNYTLRGLIALSYTFGSDFSNVVNTRF